MKNYFFCTILIGALLGCKKETTTTLKFLDEYVLSDSIQFKNTTIGGLSGVDYANGDYFFVVDDAVDPRFLIADIHFNRDTIASIIFKDVIHLNDSTESFYATNALDLESIFIDASTSEVHFVSEGSILKGKNPTVFKTNFKGNFIKEFKLPTSFENINNIKHNAVFEASSKSFDNNGFWVAMEGVLKQDGVEPTFTKTQSPIRITYFDKHTQEATKQFAYQLEHISKPAKGDINLNGVTAILEYKANHFFIVERTYQNGYGSHGNIVRVFEASLDENAINIINVNSLKETPFTPLKKKKIFDFSDISDKLSDGIIDNIEGVTFGPKLANGNESLLLISDDNFQVYGKQLNQFILMEIIDK